MRIELATCPVCGGRYDPLRSRAVVVVDGRVRAFCSAQCREQRAKIPELVPSVTDALAVIKQRSWWRLDSSGAKAALGATVLCFAFAMLMLCSRRHASAAAISKVSPTTAAPTEALARTPKVPNADVWIQPLAKAKRHRALQQRTRFTAAREGLTAEECRGGRCSLDIFANPGEVIMAVHDGVIQTVQRDPDIGQPGGEGRFIRIIHRGGAVISTYMQLDGIREDLAPGIPVRAGEPIGTVAAGTPTSEQSHLRFAISVRSSDGSELFIDAQPMLLIWPARDRAPGSLRRMQRGSPQPE
jgi:murein DD-endopeptidase MepM/ murein hydrolase activator NlpD